MLFSPHFQIDANRIGQRYGAFTLIILSVATFSQVLGDGLTIRGEGFIALIRGFSKAITGLSVGSTATVSLFHSDGVLL